MLENHLQFLQAGNTRVFAEILYRSTLDHILKDFKRTDILIIIWSFQVAEDGTSYKSDGHYIKPIQSFILRLKLDKSH